MHYVYFLELSNGNIYVGFSSNLKQRIKAHNDAKVPATTGFLPAKLKSYVAVETKEKATALEKYFKTGSGKAVALKRLL
ncbi:MAG TPA: GIY-YIG nuclease family protein [Candidatus Megaira endosymbiont of Nemacystus decipiens]|nr:GIY-YIG nuclease family protein [Candidatus Megaera endosymbiont of Nemacystus decipiens]